MCLIIQETNDDKQRRAANLKKWPVAQVTYLLAQLFGASAAPALSESAFRSVDLGVRGRSPVAEPDVGWSLDPGLPVISLSGASPQVGHLVQR